MLPVLSGCKKDEEILTGSISGKILTFNQYCFRTPDQPDITVKLFQDAVLIDTKSTNSNSQYVFENMPYGKYTIQVEKAGYIQVWNLNNFNHIGGYSPTLNDFYLFEIPTYQLNLDSIRKIQEYIVVFLKFNGDTLLPENVGGMPLRVFAGNTPYVSKDNFTACGRASLSDYNLNDYRKKVAVFARYEEWDMEQSFDQLKNDIIYLRIYPIASNQGSGSHDYYPEALGPPSNVISFLWKDVVSKK